MYKLEQKQGIKRGITTLESGQYLAKTFLDQRQFKSYKCAVEWLKKRGLNEHGRRILKPTLLIKATDRGMLKIITSRQIEIA